MGAGQYYDPRNVPQSAKGSGWTLISHPEKDRVHIWTRSLGPFDVTVTREAADWWEIEILRDTGVDVEIVKQQQASSRVAAFAKVNLWWFSRQETREMEKVS